MTDNKQTNPFGEDAKDVSAVNFFKLSKPGVYFSAIYLGNEQWVNANDKDGSEPNQTMHKYEIIKMAEDEENSYKEGDVVYFSRTGGGGQVFNAMMEKFQPGDAIGVVYEKEGEKKKAGFNPPKFVKVYDLREKYADRMKKWKKKNEVNLDDIPF